MKTIRLDISYDGLNYSGWQRQINSNTVEDELRSALDKANINFSHLIASGRTDAGVHANNQVVSFKTDSKVPPDRLVYLINQYLPKDIRVLNSEQADDDFDAHNSALGKSYTYYINLNQFPSPFESRYSWHYPYPLDLKKLKQACQFLSGKHDYRNFKSTGSSVKTTKREVYLIKPTLLENNILRIEFVGNGFLYNMVRILTGTIIEYANSRIEENRLKKVFKVEDRKLAGITAPAHGLFLERVFYSPEELETVLIEKS